MSGYEYQGDELQLFSHAVHWKSYWSAHLRPYVSGDVLDVGAGQGNNLEFLLRPECRSWTALEPDAKLLGYAADKSPTASDAKLHWVTGTTSDLLSNGTPPSYDSIIYIDVLEHIEHDEEEFRRAATLLRPGGHLVVLSPAYQFLYSPFDKAIGHFRRYERRTLSRLSAPGLVLDRMFFLDGAGFLLSAANRLFLRQSMPTLKQIAFWDGWVIPISRCIDPLLGRSFGRSIIGVWTKRTSV